MPTDTWRQWLQHQLPPYLDPDPAAVPALTLTPPAGSAAEAVVRNGRLILVGVGTWDLRAYRLTALAASIAAQGWGAVLAEGLADLRATALADTGWGVDSPTVVQNLTTHPTLGIATSVLWQALRPMAAQWDAWQDLLADVGNGIWAGPWLDNLGTILQVPRIGGEPDVQYQARVIGTAFTASSNGVAIDQLLAALGYAAATHTTGPGLFTTTVQWPTSPPAGFVYSQADLAAMVGLLQAVGTLATIIFASGLASAVSLSAAASPATESAAIWGGAGVTGFTWDVATWQ